MESVVLEEFLATHDIVDVGNANDGGFFIVASPTGPTRKQLAETSTPDLRELGTAAPGPVASWYRLEYNPKLRWREGLRQYDMMRRSDATVRATLRMFKTPILSARWYVEPASESTRDQNVADFIWKNLNEWMSTSFSQVLFEALLMVDFGYYAFEKVFAMGEDVTSDSEAKGKVVWQKLAPRHPLDIIQWNYDMNGGPSSIDMYPSVAAATQAPVNIPIEKLLVFTFDKEAGDMAGISALRSAYMHWYYKNNLYKIDAIQKERHGIGVPIIVLPIGFNDDDKLLADQIGRNLRTNERAHVVLPPNWEINFAKLEGQPVSALASVEHHDLQIEKNILASFMADEASQNLPESFLKSTRYVANIVTDMVNKHAIPQLVDYNWSRVGYPKLHARRIGENVDWRTFSMALRNVIGAGVIQPDDRLEEMVRDEFDLPAKDEATVRVIATPQMNIREDVTGAGSVGNINDPSVGTNINNPNAGGALPKVGPPRQAPVSKQKSVFGLPRGNKGTDRSGG